MEAYQGLFDLMRNEHNLILLQSEMDEIIRASRNVVKEYNVEKENSGSLFRELAVRGNYAIPTTDQEQDWWEEGTDYKKCGDFMIRLFEYMDICKQQTKC